MPHTLVVRIQSFPSSLGLDKDNDNGLRNLSNTGLSEILLGCLSRFFLSISRLNFSTFSNCSLTWYFVSRTSRYNIAPKGKRKPTSTQQAIHPIISFPDDLTGETMPTRTGGGTKFRVGTLTLLGGLFAFPCVAIPCTFPWPLVPA